MAKSSKPLAQPASPAQSSSLALLHAFLGARAGEVFDQHGGRLLSVLEAARQSAEPGMRLIDCGRALAEAAIAESLRDRSVLGSPQDAARMLKLHFAGQAYESFVGIFLNAQHHLIAIEELFRGTLGQTSVYPREVVRRALQLNAAAFLCAHCHPSGVCEPSTADELLTQTLKRSLALVDVRLLDHIVVAGPTHVSFAERGML